MNRGGRIAIRFALIGGALVLAVAVITLLVVRSGWFQEKVRKRIVNEIEQATGATAEIASFAFDWRELRAEIDRLVLHGNEAPEEPPLFRAERIVVGLKVISALRRDIDIALLEIDRPEISIRKDAEGNTNVPANPAAEAAAPRNVVAPVVNLAIKEIRLTDGVWRYASVKVPFDFAGRNLRAKATYDPAAPGYRVAVSGNEFSLSKSGEAALEVDTELELLVEAERIRLNRVELATGESRVTGSGSLDSLAEWNGRLEVDASLAIADVEKQFKLPIESAGRFDFKGEFVFSGREDYTLTGTGRAAELAVRTNHVDLRDIAGAAGIEVTPGGVAVTNLTASTLDGGFQGEARIEAFRTFRVNGELAGLSLQQIMPRVRVRELAWNGTVSGPVMVEGDFTGAARGNGDLTISPLPGGLPLAGIVHGAFDTATGEVTFADSRLTTGDSRIDFSGSLADGIRLSVYTERLAELLPAGPLFGWTPPEPFPIRLEHGLAQFGGLVTGVLDDPQVAGHLALGPFLYEGRLIDDANADFDYARSRLRLRSLAVRQGDTRLRGDLEVALDDWGFDDQSPLLGEVRLERGSLRQVLLNTGREIPIEGDLSGIARLSGRIGDPAITAELKTGPATAYGERVDAAQASIRYAGREIRVESGWGKSGDGELRFGGTYTREADRWTTGDLTWKLAATGFRLAQFQAVRDLQKGLDADLEGQISGSLSLRDSQPRLTALSGQVAIGNIMLEDRSLGRASLSAQTRRNVLSVRAAAGLREAAIRARAEWSLESESFGLGELQFSNLTLAALQDVGLFGGPQTNLYLEGSMDGQIGFVGPVLSPSRWRGMAKVTRLEITPTAASGRQSDRDLTLRNAGPLMFAMEPAKVTVESARMLSEDTDIEVSGVLSYQRRNPWDLQLNGSVNLAVLTAFRDDLLAEGRSTVDAAIRGSLLEPQVNGRLTFENGSFYLRDLPNGIEQANGSILFNRNRATIEKFTSRTGGGTLELGGFIGFGAEDWTYRLQAKAEGVRVRYPEETSTLLNATLDLTGSSTRSLLSGDVRVTRAAFNPSSDLARMLAESASLSPPAGITNPFLRGMQFDVHLTTAAHAEFLTSLTRDIEMEADLRLRGSPARPVLLGRIGVNRGEIQFFGNKYDIMQGEITFFNPVKIEPVLAIDLETRIRSYTVMMNFSGPLNNLNFSYRSDPPLQSQEIIALLTVGRAPGYAGSPTTSNPATTSYFQTGGSSFLGHALTSPVSNRLQRFFGVSRIKIDPQLTGVDNTPETHVTIEQQVSREITLTYVTNLARTQQQIVRIEWNFSPDWAFHAVRDSNGVFGVDFIYRRRFK